MTVEEYNRSLDEQVKNITAANLMLLVVSDIHAMQVKRIFTNGIGGDGAKIGAYSKKPMLVSKDQFTKESAFKQSFVDPDTKAIVDTKAEGDVPFFLTFKNRKTGARNTKATALMFLGDGYSELRRIQGKEDRFVNFRYTENLKLDFTNSITLSGDTYITGTKRKENSKKVGWLMEKYGTESFKLTQEEKDLFKTRTRKKLIQILKGNFKVNDK